jgi:hypothetical protein
LASGHNSTRDTDTLTHVRESPCLHRESSMTAVIVQSSDKTTQLAKIEFGPPRVHLTETIHLEMRYVLH